MPFAFLIFKVHRLLVLLGLLEPFLFKRVFHYRQFPYPVWVLVWMISYKFLRRFSSCQVRALCVGMATHTLFDMNKTLLLRNTSATQSLLGFGVNADRTSLAHSL